MALRPTTGVVFYAKYSIATARPFAAKTIAVMGLAKVTKQPEVISIPYYISFSENPYCANVTFLIEQYYETDVLKAERTSDGRSGCSGI